MELRVCALCRPKGTDSGLLYIQQYFSKDDPAFLSKGVIDCLNLTRHAPPMANRLDASVYYSENQVIFAKAKSPWMEKLKFHPYLLHILSVSAKPNPKPTSSSLCSKSFLISK